MTSTPTACLGCRLLAVHFPFAHEELRDDAPHKFGAASKLSRSESEISLGEGRTHPLHHGDQQWPVICNANTSTKHHEGVPAKTDSLKLDYKEKLQRYDDMMANKFTASRRLLRFFSPKSMFSCKFAYINHLELIILAGKRKQTS